MEKQLTAKNGLSVYHYRQDTTHSFYISVFVRMGSMYETEKNSGISHFLEHAIIRNINAHMGGRLYPLLDKYGLEFNASTYTEMVQFYISGASHAFPVAAEIIAAVLSPLELSLSDFEAERSRIRAEIREAEDRTSLSAFTLREVFGDGALARPITGSGGTVSKISRRALETYRRKSFSRENTFVYLTGAYTDGDVATLVAELEKYSLSDGEKRDNTAPVSNSFGKRGAKVALKNSDYCKVRFTFDLDMTRLSLPETDLLYAILVGGYSSELFIEMSEKRGIFYDIDGVCDRYKNIGILGFSFELRESRLYEAVELVVDLLGRMKNDILPREKCMYATYVDNSPILLDSPREVNFTLAYDNHIMDMGYTDIESRAAVYAAVTPERIREVARTVFTPANLTFTMNGNRKKVDTEKISNILSRL